MSWGLAATATSMGRKSRQSYVAQMDWPNVVPKVLRSVRRKLRSFRWVVLLADRLPKPVQLLDAGLLIQLHGHFRPNDGIVVSRTRNASLPVIAVRSAVVLRCSSVLPWGWAAVGAA